MNEEPWRHAELCRCVAAATIYRAYAWRFSAMNIGETPKGNPTPTSLGVWDESESNLCGVLHEPLNGFVQSKSIGAKEKKLR